MLRCWRPRPLTAERLSELASSSSEAVRECCFESERERWDIAEAKASSPPSLERPLVRRPVSKMPEDVGGRLKYEGMLQGVSGVIVGVETGEEWKSYEVDLDEPREAGLAINLP